MRLFRLRNFVFLIALSLIAAPSFAADKAQRIAIMPFDNPNHDKMLDIGGGIAETLITELGRIQDLTLVERSRINDAIKEIKLGQSGFVDTATAQKAGQFVGADSVVVGSFQRDPAVLRLVARLVDVQTAQVRATAKVDGKPNELISLQDQLAAKILEAIKGSVAEAERRKLGVSPSANLDAFRALSDGLSFFRLDLFQDAIASFDKALALDSNYASAHYYKGKALAKLKKWDDAIESFKRTLPQAQAEQTIKWSWDATFEIPGSKRNAAYSAIDPNAFSLQDLLSQDSIVAAQKRLVYSEQSGNRSVFYFVDPLKHSSQRFELPEAVIDVGIAFASDRVILIPSLTATQLLAGKFGMYGVSADDAAQLWYTEINVPLGQFPLMTLIDELVLTYSGPDRQLMARTDTAFQKKWQRDNLDLDIVPMKPKSTRAFGNLVIAKSTKERKIHAIRVSDGQDAWSIDLQSNATYHIVSDQAVIVFEPDRRVFAVDPETGRVLFESLIKQTVQPRTLGILGTLPTVESVVSGNALYFVSAAGEIVALDLSKGVVANRQRWRTPPQKQIRGMRVHGSRVYATTESGELLIVDSRSGSVVMSKVATKILDADYSGDDVVIASSPDDVFGLNPETGAEQWKYPASVRTKSPFYFKGAVILETSGTTRLSALDAKTGSILWQYAGGLAPDGRLADFGGRIIKVFPGNDSLFVVQPFGIREYALAKNQGLTNKEALTELAGALLEKGELDEAARFAGIVARDGDPNYPPLRYLRAKLARARRNDPDYKSELITYLGLVGRESKAGQDILAEFKKTRGLIWTAEVGVSFGNTLLAEGKLIGVNEKKLIALDPKTGRRLWQISGEHFEDRVYDSKSRRLFFASRLDRDPKTLQLFTADLDRGEKKDFARITLASNVSKYGLAFGGGRLFAIVAGVQLEKVSIRIVAFDGTSGNKLWEKPFEFSITAALVMDQTGILFYPKGNFLVYAVGRDLSVVRGDDGSVYAQLSEGKDILGGWFRDEDAFGDADTVYFGTTDGNIAGYSLSSKQVVLRTKLPGALRHDSIIHGSTLFNIDDPSIFAFDLGRETNDANRLKWRTNPQRDGQFLYFRPYGNMLFAVRDNGVGAVLDPATGKVSDDYGLLWSGSSVEDGDYRYGFTASGLAYGMQLKPAAK